MIPGLTRFSTGGMNATKVLEEIRLHRIQIPRLSPRQICVCLLWVFVVLILGLAVVYEIRTSALQAWLFSRYAAKLHYTIGPGPSPSIVFPSGGPFDRQRGYPQISNFQRRLEARGFQVAEQARFSPQLAWMAGLGVAPPYRERAATGVRIQGIGRGYLFNAASNDRLFHEFEEIPPLVVQSLLFIENRELGEKPPDPRTNPAVEWDRLAKAGLLYAGSKLGLPLPKEGGSTLATQLEKYRHSAAGRSHSLLDKFRQITGASLKVYREGSDTRGSRRQIVVDYLNTVPLAAAPGWGEVHGLGEGLYAWFGRKLDDVCAALRTPENSPEKIVAFKQVLALITAERAPSHYLIHNHSALETRVNAYTRLLAQEGILDAEFARRLRATTIVFSRPASIRLAPFSERKATNAIRIHLLELLGISDLYDLDRLDLKVNSTIDVALQNEVTQLFERLRDPDFVTSHGLRQDRLLSGGGDPENVVYSFLLFETTPLGNLLRVEADNLDEPFNINEGMKLELGSTAKLRTLAHYLEVVTQLYQELSPLDARARAARLRSARDPITRWAADVLLHGRGLDLDDFLQKALERKYSASPGEVFFTGGGNHIFGNFDSRESGGILTVRDATQHSVNLVFIRLMRDLVRFHQARLPYDADAILTDPNNPERLRWLTELVDGEAKRVLQQAFHTYGLLSEKDAVIRLLGEEKSKLSRNLAILFYAWHPGANEEALSQWLQQQMGHVEPEEVSRLVKAYGNPHLNLLDYAFLLKRDPLEIWCAGELLRNRNVSWSNLWFDSTLPRRQASAWLFHPRHRKAQDTRLRIRIEQDAFARMTPYWRRLGFPFERLVPSYATAIGSSGDRPAALAELVGVILNNGIRYPAVRIRQLRFAEGTPYQTVFEPQPRAGQRVMDESVARAMREVLAGVVTNGTAKRVAGAFALPDGTPVPVGGKTGSGDNRSKKFARGGYVVSSRAVNRTATFVFYIGDRYFGVLTVFVPGQQAAEYRFTSALPVTILRLLAPSINSRLAVPHASPVAGKLNASATALSRPSGSAGRM